jgi:queuine tRNA-ribosyltransferase
VDLAKARFRGSREPIMEGCPCPACRAGFTRGYIHYASKAGETTGPRLLTLHNLSYIHRLMADLRDAIDTGALTERVAAFMAGAAPSVR